MGGEKIKLNEAEILAYSQTLNAASQGISETCKKIYDTITRLQEDEAFKSKVAAVSYYEHIQELNAQVPKFTKGVLKFSQFLSGYLIENYTETDELAKQIQEAFNDSVNQLAAIGLIGGVVNIDKISSTAQGALNGNFISSDKIYKEAFEDTGNLEFVIRDDGAILITRDGVPIGFTTQDGISNQDTSDTSKPSGMVNESRYKNTRPETPLTDGMGNNEAIIKAREAGILPNPSTQEDTQEVGTETVSSNQGQVQRNSSTLMQGFTVPATGATREANSSNTSSLPSLKELFPSSSQRQVQKNSSTLMQGFTVPVTGEAGETNSSNASSLSPLTEFLPSSNQGQVQRNSSTLMQGFTVPAAGMKGETNSSNKSALPSLKEFLTSSNQGQVQRNSSTLMQGFTVPATGTTGETNSQNQE